jgi:aminopeptidase
LRVGLPDGHIWRCAHATSQSGIPFINNLPTEEVFTLPHRQRVSGTVLVTRPAVVLGTVLEGISLTFADGRLADLKAQIGQPVLQRMVATDDGASRLGEVALVPHGSRISESNLIFYDQLFDENASSHIALGTALKSTLANGESMDDDEFTGSGGNVSAIHIDLMVGSADLNIDGVHKSGESEPVMRSGEWVEQLPTGRGGQR